MNLSNSSHADERLVWAPKQADHTRITLGSILLVWSLLGNVLVIAVVYCNQNLRTNINYLIVNMAVSDLLIPFVAIPWMVSEQIVRPNEWLVEGPLGDALCKLVPFLSSISPYVSSFNLVIIAFQRFMAVVYPTRMQILSPRTRWILISSPWIVAMALFSPYFYTFRLTNDWVYTVCYYSWSPAFEPFTAQLTFLLIIGTVGFFIPLIAIIIFYSIIRYKLRKSLDNVVEMIEIETVRLRQRRNTRIFHMSITIVAVFTVGWCPLGVLNFLLVVTIHRHPSLMNHETYLDMQFPFAYLWYLQAAINPCIYFLFLKDFRQGLKRLYCRKKQMISGHVRHVVQAVLQRLNIVSRTQHVHHLTSIPLQSRMNINTRCTRTPGGDSNQDPTCTPPYINNTSV